MSKNNVKVVDKDGLNANYIVINGTELKYDCQQALKKLYPGKILSKVLLMHDINDSVFSNCYRNYLAHGEAIDRLYNINGIDRVGYIRIRDYNAIVAAFELKKDYTIGRQLDDDIANDFFSDQQSEDKSCCNNETMDAIAKSLENIATTLASIEKIMYDRTYGPIKDCIVDPEE